MSFDPNQTHNPEGSAPFSHTAYIGLGSNQASSAGDPVATVVAAIARLAALGQVEAVSSLYSTEPVGYLDQPPFINAVVTLRSPLAPAKLLLELLNIEREFGRDRGVTVPKGPRTLDLDLLMMDDLVLNTPPLTLPHPALAQRRFVLAPLAEIAPRAVHPLLALTVTELLALLPDTGENRQSAVRLSMHSTHLTAEKP
jgi:2-amino-4-hydroxy-6-hydroxymethyldihydropteridine diphosphokinase